MTEKEVSLMYSEATARIQGAAVELYENLHGEARDNIQTGIDDVMDCIKQFRYWANTELDLIKEISKEYEYEKEGNKQSST